MSEDIDGGAGTSSPLDSGPPSAPAPASAPSLREEISRAFDAPSESEGGGDRTESGGDEQPLYSERAAQAPQEGQPQPQDRADRAGRPSELVPPPGFKNPDAWKSTPVETKQWIKERESQMARGYGRQKQAADFGVAAHQALQPIWNVLQSQGVHPLQAVRSVAQLIGVLRTGTERERYEAFMGAAQEHGLDLRRLSEGMLPEADSTRVDPEIAEIKRQYAVLAQHAQRQQQQQVAAQQQWAYQTISGFGSRPEVAELLPYVWDDMARLLESSAVKEAGKTPDQILEEAFDLACHMNPAVRKHREQRSRTSNVNRLRGAASVGSYSQPISGGTLPSDNSIRANLEREFAAAGWR